MLGWVSELLQTFGNLFPRLIHVQQTHRAVKFAGSRAKELGPGMHWWWPLTTNVVEIPVARQTTNLQTQTLVTRDGRPVAVSGVVVYSIRSAMDALCKNWDHDDTLTDIAMTAIAEVVCGLEYEELMGHVRDGTLERELTKKARRRLRQFGVQVDRCALTDVTPCRVLRHFGIEPS